MARTFPAARARYHTEALVREEEKDNVEKGEEEDEEKGQEEEDEDEDEVEAHVYRVPAHDEQTLR